MCVYTPVVLTVTSGQDGTANKAGFRPVMGKMWGNPLAVKPMYNFFVTNNRISKRKACDFEIITGFSYGGGGGS